MYSNAGNRTKRRLPTAPINPPLQNPCCLPPRVRSPRPLTWLFQFPAGGVSCVFGWNAFASCFRAKARAKRVEVAASEPRAHMSVLSHDPAVSTNKLMPDLGSLLRAETP